MPPVARARGSVARSGWAFESAVAKRMFVGDAVFRFSPAPVLSLSGCTFSVLGISGWSVRHRFFTYYYRQGSLFLTDWGAEAPRLEIEAL
jgi:hypothetical protein